MPERSTECVIGLFVCAMKVHLKRMDFCDMCGFFEKSFVKVLAVFQKKCIMNISTKELNFNATEI